jgi:hypothetical protein
VGGGKDVGDLDGGWESGDQFGLALVGGVRVLGVVGGFDEGFPAVGELQRGGEAAGEAGADRRAGLDDFGA